MGWFRKSARGGDEGHDGAAPAIGVVTVLSAGRATALDAHGTPANAVITGIELSSDTESVRHEFAITAAGPDGAMVRWGIRVVSMSTHRLRLGLPVVVRVEDGDGVLDWPAMTAAWGGGDPFFSQRPIRRPPADGVDDSSRDHRVQRRLAKWPRHQATIVGMDRRQMMGMATENWDIALSLGDGRVAISEADRVPVYAQWDAAPGAVVPIAIDPDDPRRAVVDWPAFAVARSATVAFDDVPAAGGIAAALAAPGGVNTRVLGTIDAAGTFAPPPPPPGAPPRPAGW